MMQEANVKRYRAATMRAALEKVKQEMGEDALVLESKRVRAGGFLGLGAQEVVELRVIPNPASEVQPKAQKSARRSPLGLNLTDDAPAAPTHDAPVTEALKTGKSAPGAAGRRAAKSAAVKASEVEAAPPQPMLGALAARAYGNAARDQAEGVTGDLKFHAAAAAAPEARRGGAAAETAPRVVHARPAAAQAAPPAAAPEAKPEAKSAPRDAAGLDFARQEMARMRSELRSELRAISYSINSFAALSREFDSRETRCVLEADPELFEFPYYESYLLLVSTGLTPDAARKAVRAAMKNGLREVRDVNTVARAGLVGTLQNLVRFGEDPLAAAPGEANAPAALVLVGPTGVGKTTTVAKLAARVVCRLRRRCELITLDTYRIAAVEQLKAYAEIMGVGCHVAHNVHELDALARRYAGEATVLIDTAGRSPHDLAEEMELGDYLRERADLMKLLVLPATTQGEDVRAALRQFAIYGANRLVLTKLDETARPGAAITAVAASHLPLLYLCAGQRVPEDFERATPLTLASHVVRAGAAAAAV
jgi:flagellar biosynthesis protein FlhF